MHQVQQFIYQSVQGLKSDCNCMRTSMKSPSNNWKRLSRWSLAHPRRVVSYLFYVEPTRPAKFMSSESLVQWNALPALPSLNFIFLIIRRLRHRFVYVRWSFRTIIDCRFHMLLSYTVGAYDARLKKRVARPMAIFDVALWWDREKKCFCLKREEN